VTPGRLEEAARAMDRDEPFVRVVPARRAARPPERAGNAPVSRGG
jgi:hypothetical protein